MNPFTYERPDDVDAAITLALTDAGAQYIAGGTSMIDLMKEGVERPTSLVDISRLPLTG